MVVLAVNRLPALVADYTGFADAWSPTTASVVRALIGVAVLAGLVLVMVISFTTLTIAGVVGRRELELGALLVPASLLGAWVSRYTAKLLPAETVRPAVLLLCAASAVVLMLEAAL